jgi:hypothetical protein
VRALVDPRSWTCGFISRADVADFLVKQIDDDAFLHKTPVLKSWRERRSRRVTRHGLDQNAASLDWLRQRPVRFFTPHAPLT